MAAKSTDTRRVKDPHHSKSGTCGQKVSVTGTVWLVSGCVAAPTISNVGGRARQLPVGWPGLIRRKNLHPPHESAALALIAAAFAFASPITVSAQWRAERLLLILLPRRGHVPHRGDASLVRPVSLVLLRLVRPAGCIARGIRAGLDRRGVYPNPG